MHVAIVIVSLRQVGDLLACLPCITAGAHQDFCVVVSENGGPAATAELLRALRAAGLLQGDAPLRLAGGQALHIVTNPGNLGYAGGVNAGIADARCRPWDAIWVLNGDTMPEPAALAAMVARMAEGGYGMVGSRLVLVANGLVQCWAGLQWRRWMYRGRLLGFRAPVDTLPDMAAVEAALDVVSGASMLVSRDYIEAVGVMDDAFFLFCEDVDWCLRRGAFRLGYAHASVVRHVHGAQSGASVSRAGRKRFSVYLMHRNAVLTARRYAGMRLLPVLALRLVQAFEELLRFRQPRHFLWALQGFWAGVRNETGKPGWMG